MVVAELGHTGHPGEVIRTGWPIWYGFKKTGQPDIRIGQMPTQLNVGPGASQAATAIKNGTSKGENGGCCGSQWW
ncbi:MAG: hypothetical protein A2Y38_02925 [Spirochaetes bacterium GWB1_59_5]|nr:MAG: hypothetical protein A2Y38_02925 [Spirochaetes bacterium GWB1_59_5]